MSLCKDLRDISPMMKITTKKNIQINSLSHAEQLVNQTKQKTNDIRHA